MKRLIILLAIAMPMCLYAQSVSIEREKPAVKTHERVEHSERSVTQPSVNSVRESRTRVNTEPRTQVNVSEFKSKHQEVFRYGRHPKEFFVSKFGVNHVRLIDNSYFVFVDGCWIAVDVDGFVYTDRIICPGDPQYIEVVD